MKRIALVLVGVSLALTACAAAPKNEGAQGTVQCNYRVTNKAAKPIDPPTGKNVPATGTVDITLTFDQGPVTLTLDRSAAPCTVNSFESLARQGYYNNTRCHCMGVQGVYFLQCGDPMGSGLGGPGYTFDDELTKTKGYPAGTLAMANSGPNTNGSQFFIVFKESKFPPNYTAFGTVNAASLSVIEKIAAGGIDNAAGGVGTPKGNSTIKTAAAG